MICEAKKEIGVGGGGKVVKHKRSEFRKIALRLLGKNTKSYGKMLLLLKL
jgi:hypothetical protein